MAWLAFKMKTIASNKWADSELQPSSVQGGEDFTADFTFEHDHFFQRFSIKLVFN